MHAELADLFTEIVVDAVRCIRREGEAIDLHMVEVSSCPHPNPHSSPLPSPATLTLTLTLTLSLSLTPTPNPTQVMHMQHRSGMESRLVKGLVMDHGGRHPGMPKKLSKCHILCMNVDLEYQKSEVASGFFYNSAGQRESMVAAERKWVDDRTQLILDLKNKACKPGETFVIINQKGIDPLALDMLAREGILALRRAKKRNMERVVLACGGETHPNPNPNPYPNPDPNPNPNPDLNPNPNPKPTPEQVRASTRSTC